MQVLSFNCQSCGVKIIKLKFFKDIFFIKSGKKIVCQNCGSSYSVPKIIKVLGSLYNYLFIGGLSIFIWLFLTVFIGDILGKDIANFLGIWIWVLSAIIYIIAEFIIAIVLVLEQNKD